MESLRGNNFIHRPFPRPIVFSDIANAKYSTGYVEQISAHRPAGEVLGE
jgi:hypothetical protein